MNEWRLSMSWHFYTWYLPINLNQLCFWPNFLSAKLWPRLLIWGEWNQKSRAVVVMWCVQSNTVIWDPPARFPPNCPLCHDFSGHEGESHRSQGGQWTQVYSQYHINQSWCRGTSRIYMSVCNGIGGQEIKECWSFSDSMKLLRDERYSNDHSGFVRGARGCVLQYGAHG